MYKNIIIILFAVFFCLISFQADAQNSTQNSPRPEVKEHKTDKKDSAATAEENLMKKVAEMTDINDIKPLEKTGIDPALLKKALYAGAVILIICLISAFFFYFRKKKNKDKNKEIIIIPPDETALKQLKQLKASKNISEKNFYFKLSAILRAYLTGRFDFNALEMTTQEILPVLRKLELDNGLKSSLKKFLFSSEPVKFAEIPVDKIRMEADFIFVEDFVNKTTFVQEES